MGALVRYIVAESRGELSAVISEKLRVVRSARDGNIRHAIVEQVFRSQLRVHMHQNPLSSLALAGMAGDRVAVIEMRMLIRINPYLTAIIHLQADLPLLSNRPDCP
jgi:hypothetical protein